MHVGDQHEQARHLLTALEQPEFAAKLDLVGIVGRTRRNADDLRLRGLRLQDK